MFGKAMCTAAAAALIGLSTSAASAAVIQNEVLIDGEKWLVSILETDSFDNQSSVLTDQVWWGDADLAFQFAEAFGTSDDSVNPETGGGGLFAYATPFPNQVRSKRCSLPDFCSSSSYLLDTTRSKRFAIASLVSTVPLPAGLPLLLAGIGGLGLMARKKRRAQI